VQHVLDRHATDDCPEVAGEEFVDGGPHAVGVLLEEAAGGIGDRGEIVTDLVSHDALDLQRDRLIGDGIDDQPSRTDVQS